MSNPLDMPMLWPQPQPGLGLPNGIAPPPPIMAATVGVPMSDSPFAPVVRSYVTYGGGRFTSRQLAAFAKVRQREAAMRGGGPTRVVPVDTAEAAPPPEARHEAAPHPVSPASLRGGEWAPSPQPHNSFALSTAARASGAAGPWLLEATALESAGAAAYGRDPTGLASSSPLKSPLKGALAGLAVSTCNTTLSASVTASTSSKRPGAPAPPQGAPLARVSVSATSKRERVPPNAAAQTEAWWMHSTQPLRGYGAARQGDRQMAPLMRPATVGS